MTQLARTLSAGPVVAAAGGTIGTSSAHKAFSKHVVMADGRTAYFYRRSTDHGGPGWRAGSTDGVICVKIVDDPTSQSEWDAATETVVFQTSGYDYRTAIPRLLVHDDAHPGRIGIATIRTDWSSSPRRHYTFYSYSDDNCATFASLVAVTSPLAAASFYADDLAEMQSGRLLIGGYGEQTLGAGDWTVHLVKSTSSGATWANGGEVAEPSDCGGYGCVECQVVPLNATDVLVTFHTEDGVPTTIWKASSSDAGDSFGAPAVQHASAAANMNATLKTVDGDVVEAYYNMSQQVLRQSWDDGTTYGTSIAIQSPPSGFTSPLWLGLNDIDIAAAAVNLGVTHSWEKSTQDQANVYFTAFTRGSDTPPPLPEVTGSDVGSITTTGATITGSVDPNGTATTYRVEIGPTTSYGTETAWEDAGSGSSPVAVEVPISGLDPGSVYHARLVATSAAGTTYGPDVQFTTDALPVPDVGLTLDESSIWTQTGTSITARALIGRRSTITATAYSPNGGPIWGDGAQADRFDIDGESLDGESTIVLEPATPRVVELGVTPLAGDDTLTIRIGTPE